MPSSSWTEATQAVKSSVLERSSPRWISPVLRMSGSAAELFAFQRDGLIQIFSREILWFSSRFLTELSIVGIRLACLSCSSRSLADLNNPRAGLAFFHCFLSIRSQSGSAAYTWHTVWGSPDLTASSMMIDKKSASDGAWVEIIMVSGFSCAPWEVRMASMNGVIGPLTWPTSSRIARMGDRPCAVWPSAESARYSTLDFRP